MARPPGRPSKAWGGPAPNDEAHAAARVVIDQLVPAGWRVLTWTSWDPVPAVIDYERQSRLTHAPWGVHLMAAYERAALDVLFDLLEPEQVWGLHLRHRPMAHGEVALLERFPLLEQLDIGGSQLDEDDLRVVGGLTNLLQLELVDTGVTDAGVAHLRSLQRLRVLNLIDTPVTDTCIDTLVTLPDLDHVALAGTAVTAGGVERLAAMPSMRVLRTPWVGLRARARLMWRYRDVSFL